MFLKMSLFLSLCLMIGLMSCSRSLVKSDYDREINFAKYKTYNWMEEPTDSPTQDRIVRNTLFEKRLKSAVDAELQAKGFRKQTNKPDFLIGYYVKVEDKVEVSSRNFGYDLGYYRFGYWSRYYGIGYYPRFSNRVDVYQYKEGTLILDFVDPKSMELIWRGWQTAMVDAGGIREEKINQAAKEILEQYPPQ